MYQVLAEIHGLLFGVHRKSSRKTLRMDLKIATRTNKLKQCQWLFYFGNVVKIVLILTKLTDARARIYRLKRQILMFFVHDKRNPPIPEWMRDWVLHGASSFPVCGRNPLVWPFKWNLSRGTFTWCCLRFSLLQNQILIFCPILTLQPQELSWLIERSSYQI